MKEIIENEIKIYGGTAIDDNVAYVLLPIILPSTYM